MKAFQLARVDREYEIALQAWMNHQVTATDKNGKPVYKKFKDFFDYEERVNAIYKPEPARKLTPKMRKMARIAAKVNEGR